MRRQSLGSWTLGNAWVLWGAALTVGAVASGQERGELFNRLDANKDGFVTADEVEEPQRGLFERLVRTSDKDDDKKLSREEFASGLREGGGPRGQGGPGGEGGQRGEGGLRRGGPFGGGPPPGRPGGPQGMGPPGGGLFAALDANRDGQLSNDEIVGAGTALLKLDRNNDGRVTPDEAFGPPGPPREGDRPGERRFADRRPEGGPPMGDPRPEDGRRPDGPPGEGRRGEGRPGENRPGENRFGAGRGNFGPEAFLARLKEADANSDGKLSKDEAPPMLRERFDQADANSDGFLDEAEMRRITERMRGGPGPRRDGDRRPEDVRPDTGDKQ